MSISKSRLPKSARFGRDLDNELLPDPADYFASARYIDRRAELGDFSAKGTPAAALPVLHYLWRHTARKLDGLGQNEGIGWVLSGKSKLGKIAAECGIAYSSAQRAIDWLAIAEWLDGAQAADGRSYRFRVRMDIDGHNHRMKLLGETVVSERTAGELSAPPSPGPCAVSAQAVVSERTVISAERTVPGQRAHTLQGFDLDLDLDFGSERTLPPSAEDQDQKPSQRQAAGPSAQELAADAKREAALAEEVAAARRAQEEGRRATRQAEAREQEAQVSAAMVRLREMIRAAGSVSEKDVSSQFDVNARVWWIASALVTADSDIEVRYDNDGDRTFTWTGRAA
jgi:hypothetical protein